MALAQAAPRSGHDLARIDNGAGPLKRLPSVESVLARVFGPEAASADNVNRTQAMPRDFNVAFDALRKGSESLRELSAHCGLLRSELDQSREQHCFDLEGAREEIQHWQETSNGLSDTLKRCQGQLDDALRVAAMYKDLAAKEATRAETAEQKCEKFEQIAMAFHDQIVAAFGLVEART